jgi:hypothetical protein
MDSPAGQGAPTAGGPARGPRIHFDLHVADASEQEAEAARLVSLGASRVDWDRFPDDPDFIVLADPEGNRFCIVDLAHDSGNSQPAVG